MDGGKVVRLEFTTVKIWWDETCSRDFVKVTDGDGTLLMDESCGNSKLSDILATNYFQLPNITTKTNKVEIYFHTDESFARSGWNLTWTAVAEGSKHSVSFLWNS